jgi:hypothetical protein
MALSAENTSTGAVAATSLGGRSITIAKTASAMMEQQVRNEKKPDVSEDPVWGAAIWDCLFMGESLYRMDLANLGEFLNK